jgi:GNAT superfamily N-acetyltransferase
VSELRVTGHDGYVSVTAIEEEFIGAVAEASRLHVGIWYLNRVLIRKPESRRKGLGSLMVKRLQEELRKTDCTKLIVEPGGYGSVPEELRIFYERCGFVLHEDGYMEWKP